MIKSLLMELSGISSSNLVLGGPSIPNLRGASQGTVAKGNATKSQAASVKKSVPLSPPEIHPKDYLISLISETKARVVQACVAIGMPLRDAEFMFDEVLYGIKNMSESIPLNLCVPAPSADLATYQQTLNLPFHQQQIGRLKQQGYSQFQAEAHIFRARPSLNLDSIRQEQRKLEEITRNLDLLYNNVVSDLKLRGVDDDTIKWMWNNKLCVHHEIFMAQTRYENKYSPSGKMNSTSLQRYPFRRLLLQLCRETRQATLQRLKTELFNPHNHSSAHAWAMPAKPTFPNPPYYLSLEARNAIVYSAQVLGGEKSRYLNAQLRNCGMSSRDAEQKFEGILDRYKSSVIEAVASTMSVDFARIISSKKYTFQPEFKVKELNDAERKEAYIRYRKGPFISREMAKAEFEIAQSRHEHAYYLKREEIKAKLKKKYPLRSIKHMLPPRNCSRFTCDFVNKPFFNSAEFKAEVRSDEKRSRENEIHRQNEINRKAALRDSTRHERSFKDESEERFRREQRERLEREHHYFRRMNEINYGEYSLIRPYNAKLL